MKQIQQIRLIDLKDPTLSVVQLNPKPDLSRLGSHEKIYVVSHGIPGEFFGFGNPVDKDTLIRYFTDSASGLPTGFNGEIVILSCYSGPELAAAVANGLRGRAATGTVVKGATGYSYGTREFRNSGRSSVLSLAEFYRFSEINKMVSMWLDHKPTHDKGVLNRDLGITVDTNKTIKEQLGTLPTSTGTPDVIANRYARSFATEAKEIEDLLKDRVGKIPGTTAAQRAEYLVTQKTEQLVTEWNKAIDRQYELFSDLYLWAPTANAFTTAHVP